MKGSIPATQGTSEDEPAVVNMIMGKNNLVEIAGRNARVSIHGGIVARSYDSSGKVGSKKHHLQAVDHVDI